jgi:hypothetical protein
VEFDGATLAHYYYAKDAENILEYNRGTYTVLHDMPTAQQWTIPTMRMREAIDSIGMDLVAKYAAKGFDITKANWGSAGPDPIEWLKANLTDAEKAELGITSDTNNFNGIIYQKVVEELGYADSPYVRSSFGQSLRIIEFNSDGSLAQFKLVDKETDTTRVDYEDGEYYYRGG